MSTTHTLRNRGPASQEQSLKHNLQEEISLVKKTILRLYHWNEIPDWQKDNSYILTGYVRETLDYLACLKSLTYIHNETINIYSHLIPGLLLIVSNFFLVNWNLFLPTFTTTVFLDKAIVLLFLMGLSSCLALSSCFHCFKCHSLEISAFINKLDYLGINILITTSMLSLIYFALIDYPHLISVFWSITLVLGAICSISSLHSSFSSVKWRPYRATMFVLFGLSGLFPVVSSFVKIGYAETWNRAQLNYIFLEAFLYIFGAFLYAARIPERFWPGKFDLYGHSHQLFHFLVVLAACAHGKGLIESYKYAHQYVLLAH
ncbi:hemolysin III family protein [Ascoidea rubescens DSM 1968]|uniref:HlyIII-domain-containing protein n=1 Tax=Ascoidea rubescens DSM 1968 TaxID=1344418 RepID=A0A1D2V9F5_9ASCO|nr:HlyIII-domain-containing protein [Ascoidea rubescens DSM 1968]ODV58145.1 HlyIII-domain-containing protein [Ascoidea rubescens DSM 1968]